MIAFSSRTTVGPTALSRRVAGWLAAVLLLAFVAAGTVTGVLWLFGYDLADAARQTSPGRIAFLAREPGYDSWRPLLRAGESVRDDPAAGCYAVFHSHRGKFQYPPLALLAYRGLPASVSAEAIRTWAGSRLQHWHGWISRFAFLATVVVSILILRAGFRLSDASPTGFWLPALLAVPAAFTFYPLIVAHELGQFQLLLDAWVALALLAFMRGQRALAGGFLGLCCVLKPPLALVLPWALLRRQHSLALAFTLVTLAGFGLSLLVFGWSAHLDYLAVLRTLSRHGEAFWFNQSLGGVLHRWVDPAAALTFDAIGSPLPPYRAGIHVAGLVFGLALVTLVLFRRRPATEPTDAIFDFCALLLAATLASPVAWNHHFGVCFPIVCAVLPPVLAGPAPRRWPALLLGVAFLAIGFELIAPEFVFASPLRGLLGAHVFFGALGLLALLLIWRLPVDAVRPAFALRVSSP